MLKYLIVSLSVLTLASAGEKYMVFEKPPSTIEVSESIAVLNEHEKNVEWYASWPTKYVVKLFVTAEISVKFHCTVNNLDPSHNMKDIKYCFNRHGTAETEKCKTLQSNQLSDKMIVDVGSTSIQVDLTFNPITGGLATIANVPLSADVSMDFYCSMSSNMGSVMSNIVRIIDWRFRGGVISIDYPKGKLYEDEPISIPCEGEASTKPVPKEITLNYRWKTCATDDWRKCDYTKVGGQSLQILNDGTLYIPFFDKGMAKLFEGQFINCFIDANQRSRSTKRFEFQVGSSPNRITKLTVSAPEASGTPLELINTKDEVARYCNFQIGPGTVDVKWYKDVKGIRIELTSTNSDIYKVSFEKPYKIAFKGPYNSNTHGKYICHVSWYPEDGSPTQTAEGSYDVSIKYYPEASQDVIPKLYVVSGNNGTFQCSFLNPFPNDKNAVDKVQPSLEINGFPLKLTSQADFDTSVQNINYRFVSSMAHLQLSVSPLNPQPSDNLTYLSMNMKDYDSVESKSSTHMVTCIGKNSLGAVRKNVLLQVVPKLKFSVYPSNTNCSSCLAEVEHEFKCVVSNLQVYNTTSTRLIISQYWILGEDTIIVQDNQFVAISSDNTTLTLKNMTDMKNIEMFNNDYGKITCVVTMSYPPDMEQPSGLRTNPLGRKYFFISSDDPDEAAHLSAKVILIDRPIAAANLTWVIALSLSLLVLIIVVILVVAWFQKRPPAETYDVDRTEKQQGNDPDAENEQKQAFPMYERTEEGPIQGSRMTLDGSIQIASDDEDLAEYEADIGHFNEQASFIGEYDDRNTTNRKLSASNV